MAVEGMPILLQKDTTFTKLFVGGLPYHTTDATLHAFFLQYGEIEEAVVIHDRVTGKSKGYGFVTMVDKEGAEKACANPNPMIDGRKANVNLAYLGAKPKLHNSQPGSPITIPALQRSDSPNALFNATQQSPPPFPLGLHPHGLFFPPPQGYFDGPPFSPPPMFPPFMFPQYHLPPQFNPNLNYAPPVAPGQNFSGGQQQLPPLVPYNAAN